jgi:hypothetical protein
MLAKEQIEYWKHEIKKAIDGELEHTSFVFENLADRILSNIRFGFFRTEQQPHKELGWKSTLEINVVELLVVEGTLLPDVYKEYNLKHRMFGPAMYADPKPYLVKVDFDYDINRASLTTEETFLGDATVDQFMQKWELRATLPIYNVVFDIPKDGDLQEWQYEYVEAYENWMYRVNDTRRSKYIQIGGWADFRQSGDYYDYVAQIDTEHGDCGAVYLEYADGKFVAYDQMC